MSTWAQLRKDVLYALGENRAASSTNEVRQQVDRKLEQKRDEIYGLRAPRSLLVYSGPITITTGFSYASIEASGSGTTPGFALTDFWKIFSISLTAGSDTEISNAQEFEYVEWDSWVRLCSAVEGNQRLPASFTVDYQNRIYLVSAPNGSDTWNMWINYYKLPATIVDAGIPEIGIQFERVLTLGTTLEFPDMFRGEERASVFAATMKLYEDAKTDYKRAETPKFSGSRRRPFRKNAAASPIFWPGYQSS